MTLDDTTTSAAVRRWRYVHPAALVVGAVVLGFLLVPAGLLAVVPPVVAISYTRGKAYPRWVKVVLWVAAAVLSVYGYVIMTTWIGGPTTGPAQPPHPPQ